MPVGSWVSQALWVVFTMLTRASKIPSLITVLRIQVHSSLWQFLGFCKSEVSKKHCIGCVTLRSVLSQENSSACRGSGISYQLKASARCHRDCDGQVLSGSWAALRDGLGPNLREMLGCSPSPPLAGSGSVVLNSSAWVRMVTCLELWGFVYNPSSQSSTQTKKGVQGGGVLHCVWI